MVPIPFHTIDWSQQETVTYPGESGVAHWKSMNYSGLRIRVVEYSPGYQADHWCSVGHILYCLKGELVSELSDGSKHILKEGMSYQVGDNMSRHRSSTATGATLFIVDGAFLSFKESKGVFGLQ